MTNADTILSDMLIISNGTFSRGSHASPDEQPIKQVSLSPFAIDKTPVTNKQFRVFVEHGGYDDPAFWLPKGWEYIQENEIKYPNYWYDNHFNQDDHPVTGVSWWEAMAYAKFSKKTLPTETQWEYACKGMDDRKYPWGNEEPTLDYANFAYDCDPTELDRSSTSVYAHPKNKSFFGCLDMAGNLAEWCLDNASTNYKWDKDGKDPVYITNDEDYHMVRGGCGLHNEDFMRCTARDYYPVSVRDNLVGFRCVINNVKGEEF
ncbi:SUMF1/EgtB/PvdO family nonheme iron enzyme [Bacillus siamensis]|uniref:formylglycine-generating enzyme family protein n=1 Tax=Bacillus siamensis TaxID=659243 RepID=UPI0022B7CAC1|nr:SUMF1/EgtB/PvdO family nonheme iron enzyme [Bacillus siamensis]MEC3656505.1 SUMF1/EgtB/PvdO family nonheme iron enzyme [Bacillus siamensis]MED5048646.1 SUMF1/EgtB/PvdO family nonheme iron enzyme [Bacillus siamensis]MED5096232.1 SUMF1/EgtB/PvdO family nonheme iron enzyme [Bacillus siamensis]